MNLSCCVYKRPFDAGYPWTCPTCGTVHEEMLPEESAQAWAAIRALNEPSEEEQAEHAEDLRIIERALSCFVSDYETSRPDADIEKAKNLLARMRGVQ
jgi:hypothetical protein